MGPLKSNQMNVFFQIYILWTDFVGYPLTAQLIVQDIVQYTAVRHYSTND